MMEADLVVVTAGKELLQRFDPKADTKSSSKSASFASDKSNQSTQMATGSEDGSILALANGNIDLYSAMDLRATIGDSEGDVDIESDLQDSRSDESNRSHDKYQQITKDIEAEISALSRGDFGGEDLFMDVGDAISLCDSISSNDIPTMLSDMSDSDSVSEYNR